MCLVDLVFREYIVNIKELNAMKFNNTRQGGLLALEIKPCRLGSRSKTKKRPQLFF